MHRYVCGMGDKVLNIVWFKRDLRVWDNAALAGAAAAGPVLPIYIVEPELWAQPDASGRQWAFVAECLGELQRELAARGAPLRVFQGDAVQVLQSLALAGPVTLWSHEETGNAWTYARDRRVAEWARQAGVVWHECRQTGVIRRLRSRDGWARAWDADMAKPLVPAPRALTGLAIDAPTAVPSMDLADDPCPGRQAGGRREGLAVLDAAGAGLPVSDVQPGDRL